MNKLTLVVLAAGMGSRYGGLKQIDEMTDQGDTIIDFSIYDAIDAGFSKIVFIIRNSFKDEFIKVFGSKLKGKAEVVYVYQELEDVPDGFINSDRVKPWGTGHALLMAKDVVGENFAVINADDFYGKEAFEVMGDKLQSVNKVSSDFYMVGYQLKNTVSDHGFVSRGQCYVDDQGFLDTIIERTHIEKIKDRIFYKDENEELVKLGEDTPVSMNFWGFTPKVFNFLEREFLSFLKANSKELKKEFFIPLAIDTLLKNKEAKVEVLTSKAKWLGVTYKEDKMYVASEIAQLKRQKIYPKQLW